MFIFDWLGSGRGAQASLSSPRLFYSEFNNESHKRFGGKPHKFSILQEFILDKILQQSNISRVYLLSSSE